MRAIFFNTLISNIYSIYQMVYGWMGEANQALDDLFKDPNILRIL